ncbi:hypothetical protein B0H11DRAFT_1942646 [Mycena galericulata]|nr:hypothetical protein B0H11DRAFT_1942646 [Mycena galericulata]
MGGPTEVKNDPGSSRHYKAGTPRGNTWGLPEYWVFISVSMTLLAQTDIVEAVKGIVQGNSEATSIANKVQDGLHFVSNFGESCEAGEKKSQLSSGQNGVLGILGSNLLARATYAYGAGSLLLGEQNGPLVAAKFIFRPGQQSAAKLACLPPQNSIFGPRYAWGSWLACRQNGLPVAPKMHFLARATRGHGSSHGKKMDGSSHGNLWLDTPSPSWVGAPSTLGVSIYLGPLWGSHLIITQLPQVGSHICLPEVARARCDDLERQLRALQEQVDRLEGQQVQLSYGGGGAGVLYTNEKDEEALREKKRKSDGAPPTYVDIIPVGRLRCRGPVERVVGCGDISNPEYLGSRKRG